MDASETPAPTPYDVLRVVRKFLRSESVLAELRIEDYATAHWLARQIDEQLGD